MSQYQLTGVTANGPVQIMLGWDRPLKYFFMVIEPEREPPLYSNLDEIAWEQLTLAHYQQVLERFGISNICLKAGHPCGLYEKLITSQASQWQGGKL